MGPAVKNILGKILAVTIPVTAPLSQSTGAFASETLIRDNGSPRTFYRGGWSSRGHWKLFSHATTRHRRHSHDSSRDHVVGNAGISPVPPDAVLPDEGGLVTSGDELITLPAMTPVNSNDLMSLSDGASTVSAPALKTSVQDTSAQTGSVSLSWTAPVARADGAALALSEITGYTVYYGTTAGDFPNSINVNHGSSTSATISKLPAGTYFMVVTTRDSDGRESGQSGLVTKQVQ